ncbi:ROK family protein [Fontibacillus phaseoli]|uniref:fructokinase n=1 Tax=Fontibacillus phaseoli TaxID=1416533 RepID=A0A369BRQ5_9BACL|nr:ROK family protein [Fontibacillus phaseoli]
MKREFDVPYGWDTDVNAAALGAAKGLDSCVYYTIGTGGGIGIVAEGKAIHGLVHPEGGHIPVRRHPEDSYQGNCPYHQDCLEGMTAGPALERRWGVPGKELTDGHPAWALEAYYIGQAVTATVLTLSPKKVILGGGVMGQKQLFPLIHTEVKRNLQGYVSAPELGDDIAHYIVPPGLGENAGLKGALVLGLNALKDAEVR